jgi:serine/threonine protein kinase
LENSVYSDVDYGACIYIFVCCSCVAPLYVTGQASDYYYDDEYIGTLGFDISLTAITELVSTVKFTRRFIAFVMDSSTNAIIMDNTTVALVFGEDVDIFSSPIASEAATTNWPSIFTSIKSHPLSSGYFESTVEVEFPLLNQNITFQGEGTMMTAYVFYYRWDNQIPNWVSVFISPVEDVTNAIWLSNTAASAGEINKVYYDYYVDTSTTAVQFSTFSLHHFGNMVPIKISPTLDAEYAFVQLTSLTIEHASADFSVVNTVYARSEISASSALILQPGDNVTLTYSMNMSMARGMTSLGSLSISLPVSVSDYGALCDALYTVSLAIVLNTKDSTPLSTSSANNKSVTTAIIVIAVIFSICLSGFTYYRVRVHLARSVILRTLPVHKLLVDFSHRRRRTAAGSTSRNNVEVLTKTLLQMLEEEDHCMTAKCRDYDGHTALDIAVSMIPDVSAEILCVLLHNSLPIDPITLEPYPFPGADDDYVDIHVINDKDRYTPQTPEKTSRTRAFTAEQQMIQSIVQHSVRRQSSTDSKNRLRLKVGPGKGDRTHISPTLDGADEANEESGSDDVQALVAALTPYHNYAWTTFVQLTHPLAVRALSQMLHNKPLLAVALGQCTDALERAAVDIASRECKLTIIRASYIAGRFELIGKEHTVHAPNSTAHTPGNSSPPVQAFASSMTAHSLNVSTYSLHNNSTQNFSHLCGAHNNRKKYYEYKSPNSLIVFAYDHVLEHSRLSSRIDVNTRTNLHAHAQPAPRKVALKFMRNKADFEAEVNFRDAGGGLSENYIVAIIEKYDCSGALGPGDDINKDMGAESNGDDDVPSSHITEFFAGACAYGYGQTYKFCVVLEAGEETLHQVIADQNTDVMCADIYQIRQIFHEIVKCVEYLHRQRIVHLNLTAKNIVRCAHKSSINSGRRHSKSDNNKAQQSFKLIDFDIASYFSTSVTTQRTSVSPGPSYNGGTRKSVCAGSMTPPPLVAEANLLPQKVVTAEPQELQYLEGHAQLLFPDMGGVDVVDNVDDSSIHVLAPADVHSAVAHTEIEMSLPSPESNHSAETVRQAAVPSIQATPPKERGHRQSTLYMPPEMLCLEGAMIPTSDHHSKRGKIRSPKVHFRHVKVVHDAVDTTRDTFTDVHGCCGVGDIDEEEYVPHPSYDIWYVALKFVTQA